MEVHPAGLSADGMRQAHDQGSGLRAWGGMKCVCDCGEASCSLSLAYCWVLLFCLSDCIAYHYGDVPAARAAKLACESNTIKGLCLLLLLLYCKLNTKVDSRTEDVCLECTTGLLPRSDSLHTSAMTDIFVVRGNQSGTPNGNKNTLHNISGAGIKKINQGIREYIIPKGRRLRARKDNGDSSAIKQLIHTMQFSTVIRIVTITSWWCEFRQRLAVLGGRVTKGRFNQFWTGAE